MQVSHTALIAEMKDRIADLTYEVCLLKAALRDATPPAEEAGTSSPSNGSPLPSNRSEPTSV